MFSLANLHPPLCLRLHLILLCISLLNGEYQDSPPRKRTPNEPILFVHFTKAGGSRICDISKRQVSAYISSIRKRIRDPRNNCNFRGDGPQSLKFGAYGYANTRMTCDDIQKRAKQSGLLFSAFERWLIPEQMNCSNAFYWIQFRNPVTRLESLMNFLKEYNKSTVIQHILNGHSRNMDNFYIRTLLGESYFNHTLKPFGSITESDLQLAKDLLDKFDMITILENHTDTDAKIQYQLGWEKVHVGHSYISHPYGYETFNISERAEIEKILDLDIELYQYAMNKSQSQSQSFQNINKLLAT